MNLNQIGAAFLLLSAALVTFSIFMSLLGMSIRQIRSLIRFLPFELADDFRKLRGRRRLSHRMSHAVVSVWMIVRRRL
ncbi:MAG TPA: hypothetical protein PKA91_14525, partial [Leptospiraceae bacterium]|nr:hypothetical protein [Leptospiraceae bacterium]